MNGLMRCMMAWVVVVGVLVFARSVQAVIKVDLPVSRLVQQARAVLVGRVIEVDRQRRVVEAEAIEKIKGDWGGAGGRFRVLVADGPGSEEVAGLLETIEKDGPVVLFVSGGTASDQEDAILHLGDRWVRGRRIGMARQNTAPLWHATGAYDGVRSFPGRTAAMADVLREIKSGGKGLQDAVSHEVCVGGVYKRAVVGLSAPATFLVSLDINGDGLTDVVAGNTGQTRVLLAEDKTFVDQTARYGLNEARGARAAVADLDGDATADLVIGSRIWLRAGEKFAAGPNLDLGDQRQWVAMGAGDANGDGRPDVAVLLRDGRLLTAENPGDAVAADRWKVTVAALWNQGGEALAAAFSADFGDDGRLHLIVVRPDSITRYPAGPRLGGGAVETARRDAADFARLTGIPLASYPFLGTMPIEPLLLAAYDYDGFGRTDWLLVTKGGGVALANRGHGAFLINRFAHEQFRPGGRDVKLPKLPFEPSLLGTLTAPGRQVQMQPNRKRGNLLVLTDKGELWEMDNQRNRRD